MAQQSKLLKLLTAPSPLPESSVTDLDISKYAEKLLKRYIGDAIEDSNDSLVPHSVLLAHYIHVPPPPSETPFEVPVIVKKKNASPVLGSFVQFTNPNRHPHLSLTERVTRKKQEGLVVVISSSNSEAKTTLCRHIHVLVKGLDDVIVPSISKSVLSKFEPEDIGFDEGWSMYSGKDIEEIVKDRRVNATSLVQVTHETSDNGEKFLKKLFTIDDEDYTNEYFIRVAPVVKTANVVFCFPKLYELDSESKSLSREIGGGGCAFYIDEDLDSDTLDNLYLISHKLCSVASNIYDVARVVSEKKTRKDYADMVGIIRHSLENSMVKGVITASTPPEILRRLLRLEVITVSAASTLGGDHGLKDKLSWKTGGIDKETVGKTIEVALSHQGFKLEIKDETIQEFDVDPRLAVIVIELGRNLRKHFETGGANASILLKLGSQNKKTIDIELLTECIHDDARAIYNRLISSSLPRGVNWINNLASKMLSDSDGCVRWSFNFMDTTKKEASSVVTYKKDAWCIDGPASVFDGDIVVDLDRKMKMTFKAESLAAIR
jgi:hypothetical protein